MTNKHNWISILAGAGILFAAASANAGVVGSKHDFTAAGSGGAQDTTTNTDEVCVFCHTPHGSADGAPVPLWNKVLNSSGAYTRYSSLLLPSFTSEEAPVGSVSLACLSCHDGTQAMDVVLNLPGSNGYSLNGTQIDSVNIGTMNPAGGPVPNLQTDLSNDHPISMQYAGGGVSTATHTTNDLFSGTLGDPDFRPPVRATINNQPIWWVDSPAGTDLTREKSDMLLYARDDLGDVQPFVECGSCHDPHNDATGSTTSVQFLRIDNTASQICTSCHTK